MKYNRTILHPTLDDIDTYLVSAKYENDFYYEKCKIGDLYDKWLNIFKSNGIIFLCDPVILKFKNNRYGYTQFTYKFNFNTGPDVRDCIDDGTTYYTLTDDDHKIIAKLFLIDGWEDEHIYTFSTRDTKNRNPNYSSNYGEVNYHTKSWVDYLTFQGSRIILQFRFDDYLKSSELRKEKLKKLKNI